MAPRIPDRLVCISCSKPVPTKEFSMNYNRIHKKYNYGRMHFCNSCAKAISEEIMGQYWDVSKNKNDTIAYALGIRAICSFFHMPYVKEAMEKMREYEINSTKSRNFSYVGYYMRLLADMDIPEGYWDDLSGNTYLTVDLLKVAKPTSEGDRALLEELEHDWGKQDSLDDYLFLEEKFATYTKGETPTPTMVNMIRYLCNAELDVMKLKGSKADISDITKAEKRVTDYYSKLKLDDFKFNKSKTEAEKLIEDWAYIHENIEPLDWEDDNLKDRLGIDKDYDDILRSIGNKCVGTKDYPQLSLDDVNKPVEDKPKKKRGRPRKAK